MKTIINNSNRKTKTKLKNVGVGTDIIKDKEEEIDQEKEKDKDKDKDKELSKNFPQRNRLHNFKFPNIDIYKKFNDTKGNYPHINLYKSKIKNSNSVGPKEKIKNYITQTENDIPRITSRYSNNKFNNFCTISLKNKKEIHTSLKYNNYKDEIYHTILVSTSIKEPELNINSDKNISNINNIYNPNDYIKYSFSNSSHKHKNNHSRNILTIRQIKNSESNIFLKEEAKNCILDLLEQKTVINFNKRSKNKPKKIRKDEFKDFLKEILQQHKKKNINKVKKKIEINALLRNKNNNYKTANKYGDDYNKAKTKYDSFKNDNMFKTIVLRNEYLNSKINNNIDIGTLTEEPNFKKRNFGK